MSLFPIVILSGGLGTRLQPLTCNTPKALIPINGEPFISHQLKLLSSKGINKVIMCLGHMADQVQEYLGNGSKFGLDISYALDGKQLLGTAGAIKGAMHLLSDNFFVINGDSYLDCDFKAIQEYFIAKRKSALMTVFKNNGLWDKSNIDYVNGEIIHYDKVNNNNFHFIDYGLGVFNKSVFNSIPENNFCDLAVIYQSLIQQKQLVAYEVKERFYENGSFAGIKDLEFFLKHKGASCLS